MTVTEAIEIIAKYHLSVVAENLVFDDEPYFCNADFMQLERTIRSLAPEPTELELEQADLTLHRRGSMK